MTDSTCTYDLATLQQKQGIQPHAVPGFPTFGQKKPSLPQGYFFTLQCDGATPGAGCAFGATYHCQAPDLAAAIQEAVSLNKWGRRPADGEPICDICYLAACAAGHFAAGAFYPAAPSMSESVPNQPADLRPSDLQTYCDHCGDSLRGEADTRFDVINLKCPRTGEVKQTVRVKSIDAWPEWAREKVGRMMRG